MNITVSEFASKSLLSPTDTEIVEKQYPSNIVKSTEEWYDLLQEDFVIRIDIRKKNVNDTIEAIPNSFEEVKQEKHKNKHKK